MPHRSGTYRGNGFRRAFLVSAMAGAGIPTLALWGCTILSPMELSSTDRRFPLDLKTSSANSNETSAGACERLNPAGECERAPSYIDQYHAGLGLAMWEVDIKRRSLTHDALERSRLNSAFNALTWPAVAYAAVERMRNPGWSPRDVVAVGFATFKILGEGIPERDRIYLQTANRMACSLMVADAYLYRQTNAPELPAPAYELGWQQDRLKAAIKLHESERGKLVTELEVASVPPAGIRNPVHEERMRAIGKLGGGGARRSDEAFLATIAKTFGDAGRTKGEAQKRIDDIDDAHKNLRHERTRILSAMYAELRDKAPAPADPLAGARQVADAIVGALNQGSGSSSQAKAQSRTAAGLQEWEPTPANLKGLTSKAAERVRQFWREQEVPLRQAREAVQESMGRHDGRVKSAKSQAIKLGCPADDIEAFIAALAIRTNAPAAPASGANQPGGESALPPPSK